MKLEYLILGLLLMQPRTGYDFKKFMDSHGVFIREQTQMSQVYRTLKQMEARGWVNYTVHTRPGAQDAKIYRTTGSGRIVFMQWLTSPMPLVVGLTSQELRARLWFSGFLGDEQLVTLLNTEIDERERQVAKYRFRDRTIVVDPHSSFDLELATFVEEHSHHAGAAAMDAHIASMKSLRDALREQIASKSERLNAKNLINSEA